MTMVAEGIETFEELAYLQAATRIRYAQGFYFRLPDLPGRYSRWARRRSPAKRASARQAGRCKENRQNYARPSAIAAERAQFAPPFDNCDGRLMLRWVIPAPLLPCYLSP